MEVDVGHQGYVDLPLYVGQGLGRLHVGDGAADDVAAGLLQPLYLCHRGGHVPGVGLRHRLDAYSGVAAHLHVPDADLFGNPTVCHAELQG